MVYVEGGKISRLGPEEGTDSLPNLQLRPCARGLAQVQRIYHPERVRHPLKRVGERGEGRFQRIPWDEALDSVAGEMRRIKETHGTQAILNLRGAGSLDGILHRTPNLADRFFNSFGGQTAIRGIISWEGATFATRSTLGFSPPPPGPESLLQSRLVIMWGLNPSEPIFGTNTNYYLALAKERGCKFVFVDPRFTDSAAALADQWIPILPGTDTAMLVAMATVLIQEGLCNETFLSRYTFGYDRFRDYCLGMDDGIPKTPTWAEGICRVPAATISWLARQYATSRPADLRGGWAPGRTAFGEEFHRACIALAAITGNIGIPGGGPGAWLPQNFPSTLGVSFLPSLANSTGKSIVAWRWADAVLQGTAGGYPSDIKMVYSLGGDRLNQCADVNKGIEALKKVEFVVVQDQFITPMARFADIVLPAATHFEREDIQVPHIQGHYLIYNHQVIEPPEDSKSDLEILTSLAQRLGVAGFNDKTDRQWLAELMKGAPVDGRALSAQGVYRLAPPRPQVPLQEFIEDPEKYPLPTPSGKIELFSRAVAQRQQSLLPPVPQYIQDWEGPGSPVAEKYPLLLITCHSRTRVNSTFDNVPWLRELEPHALWMNSADASARGISDGQTVRVFNDIGTVIITVRSTERIMPGVVNIYQGAWYQPDEQGRDRGGCVNVLCKDTLSPAEAAATNAVLVEVAGWEE
ncbi:MAG: molybdopterin-dependent oxidoreductase [Dehalococcoidia bacterium]|nr:molybdopterin-dependent oxidoreductase [Dehalococcoidia bacterium]